MSIFYLIAVAGYLVKQLSAKLFGGDEAKEGMAAFLGRRKASWAEDKDEP